jgi:hypothetical protein
MPFQQKVKPFFCGHGVSGKLNMEGTSKMVYLFCERISHRRRMNGLLFSLFVEFEPSSRDSTEATTTDSHHEKVPGDLMSTTLSVFYILSTMQAGSVSFFNSVF